MERIDQWRLFATVARLESFSRAAKAHGCSPQAATRAVAAIEDRIGVRLFHRTTRTVTLTPDGQRYLDRSARTLAEVDALESRADTDPELRGVVSVTAPTLFGQMHVARAVDAFLREHEAVDVRLTLVDRVVSLADEGIDVAFRIGVLPDSALRARLVMRVRSVVCASPAYLERRGTPRTPDALADHDGIAFAGTTPIPHRWSFPGEGRAQRTVSIRPRLAVNDGRAAIDAALAGLGLVRVLSYQVEDLVARGKLAIVLARYEAPPLPVHAVSLPGVASRAATAFLDHAVRMLTPRR